jgi:hypothetical protein
MPTKKPKPKPEITADVEESGEGDDLVKIEFRGHVFTVPKNRDDWPTRAILEFGRARTIDDQVKGVEIILGPEQWDLLVDQIAAKAGHFDEFIVVFGNTVQAECLGG